MPANYFPATYQPMNNMQNNLQNNNAFQNNQSSIVWVQGIEGAKAYPVATGNSVLLMDSEESVFYIKTTDPSGMPQPLRVYDYTERMAKAEANVDMSSYVTRDELEERLKKITAKKSKKKKEVEDEQLTILADEQ